MDVTRSEARQSPAGAVASEQRLRVGRPVVDASEDGALRLGRVYWEEVEAFTGGRVRERTGDGGVELVLLGRAGPAAVRAGRRDVRP